eukprot:4246768-Alexandrium_andersonii.AAC.1
MSASLVGSEMCIRDSRTPAALPVGYRPWTPNKKHLRRSRKRFSGCVQGAVAPLAEQRGSRGRQPLGEAQETAGSTGTRLLPPVWPWLTESREEWAVIGRTRRDKA